MGARVGACADPRPRPGFKPKIVDRVLPEQVRSLWLSTDPGVVEMVIDSSACIWRD